MEQYFRKVFQDIYKEEEKVTLHVETIIPEALEMIRYLSKVLEETRNYILERGFNDKQEEIHFFRNIKPHIYGKLMYYNRIYKMEIIRPTTKGKIYEDYFTKEKKRLKSRHNHFLKTNAFYTYYYSGRTDEDHKYFLRSSFLFQEGLENHAFDLDRRFSTYYDYLTARIIGRELFYEYLHFRTTTQFDKIANENHRPIHWTESKAVLVELLYALHAAKAISSGQISLNKIAITFQALFKVELQDVHHTFHRMKSRSGSRTLFLNQLVNSLETYMDKNV
ncbi:RteC domain-containing protein [Riemerella anatipestifer]|nr:RteC domain-containing protein [Riemerella anatipestifer]